MNKKSDSRRHFINKKIPQGIAVVTGLGLLTMNSKAENSKPDQVRMISSDGKLYDVDLRHIPKMCRGKVSNKELLQWVEKDNITENVKNDEHYE